MTDFESWDHKTLAKLTRELSEENNALRENNRVLIDALRQEWIKDEHTSTKTRPRAMEQPPSLSRN
jgi:regulator of replication initiation timing